MKKTIVILISTAFYFASCEKESLPPRVSGEVNVGVGIVFQSGNNGGAPDVSVPAGVGWVKTPINFASPVYFCPYLQPTEFSPVAIYTSTSSFVMGVITRDMISAINTDAGQNLGEWVKITHLMLSCDGDWAQPQVIGYAP